MRSICIADVGDGLCMGVNTLAGKIIQIDCGSQQGSKVAFEGFKRVGYGICGESVFVLSHFHIDHYNGLLYASLAGGHRLRCPTVIKEVYYPRIPDFERSNDFLLYLLAMNLRVFGNETGVMECDFLKAVSRINRGQRFRFRPVSRGDVINTGGANLHVLWPPVTLDHRKALSAVRRALEDFEKALEEDEITRRLYERVEQAGVPEQYSGGDGTYGKLSALEIPCADQLESRGKLPTIVRKANRSLKNAANHMGLALFEDSQLLFLGDLGGFEVREIVKHSRSQRRRSFYIMITPHHGTQWEESLRGIRCFYSVSSVGPRLCSKLDPRFRQISEVSLATLANGDIVLPTFVTRRILSGLLWW